MVGATLSGGFLVTFLVVNAVPNFFKRKVNYTNGTVFYHSFFHASVIRNIS